MGGRYRIQTGRLQLDPVSWGDLEDIVRLKASATVTGRLAGGVRNRVLSERDMMTDLMTWGREGVGMFAVRQQGRFIGVAGVQPRPLRPSATNCISPSSRMNTKPGFRVRPPVWRWPSRMKAGSGGPFPMCGKAILWPVRFLAARA
ncbi:GNAT family N-acetyltransferase [Komagataeibacter kakiaceti]|uniref:hypothetical protein n=1 Tax=Komagataeibacter kakiaceti TaxID=943261 RepID=UPI000B1184DD|nr:hypothetical protein [Komagataeibacter kakiaceti]